MNIKLEFKHSDYVCTLGNYYDQIKIEINMEAFKALVVDDYGEEFEY